ncbi:DUF2577 domain-containing protein [Clostridium neonatale]|uniref:DUF2577 domain-containing protein n=2 Tax=Clostridium neonatale TaxID=137838 RepID=A0AAD1YBM8_9CLOT|nr:DUF2577 domain-containing protein [Clostridium neonatale]CAI3227417.1 conserved hypothetical protein [Clostridium neonatale]CAI3545283.1 conserved hypothetical protein [Clostridium neonatale]CAI3549689.1 conserved hypothetical protein [Clostridium neonatale]CAI3599362.1 conserved hypothetical protein [Clostridium neonatale]CAI3619902.1 conserved hypothetical protein [Clostridium neonatale]
MGMIQTIKKASMGAYNASNPLNIEFGTVIDSKNLTIRVEQKKTLPKEFFLVPESLTRYEVDLKHIHSTGNGSTGNSLDKLVIREGLKNGDGVVLLKIKAGSKYLILDKIANEILDEVISNE